MRLYVPATLDDLEPAVVSATAASWTVPAGTAHAVTPALAASLPGEDVEGLEWHAFLAAAHDSLVRLAGSAGGAVPLRVVVTVEVPDDAVVVPAGGVEGGADVPSRVQVSRDLPGTALVAVHVDEPEAAEDVADVLRAADEESDADASGGVAQESQGAFDDALQRVTDRDLLWYDPSEIPAIPRP
ncbi:hypothetical protein DNL40_16000 [Xylanimonas oleitrophica]|uniref:Uncharacterized protein n=1 Tax=Xylanimonas oleitrophica TaxID=2607479 RepID=A0A2W5WLI2_9MICO|nr:hypothetical protein [Xylanimonas oleitrophica]PZR51543.1 hypothetical protein DNL40_16000 [Xylanimonas oleitrophica]